MERKDKIDLTLKTLALIGGLISFFYGIHRYVEVNKEESAKAFWNQQFPIYKQLCSSASIVATSEDSVDVYKATQDFWRMYYGEARMVVDQVVHVKMSNYASILKDVERKFRKREELKFASFQLSTACRASMAASWNIPLSELEAM